MTPRRRTLILVAIGALAGAGCAPGTDDVAAPTPALDAASEPAADSDAPDATTDEVDSSPAGSTSESDTTAETPDERDVEATLVTIVASEDGGVFAWQPEELTVDVGATLVWVNEGQVSHTVTGGGLNSGLLEPGERYEETVVEAGVITYVCYLHPGMGGEITVTE